METPPPSPPPPFAVASPIPVNSGDRLLAVFCHLSFLFGVGFILPLIVYLVKKDESPFVGTHAREVLNFHLSLVIYMLCSIPLMFVLIGFLTFFGVIVVGIVCAIIGAIRASKDQLYHYPLTIRMISLAIYTSSDVRLTFPRATKKSISASRTCTGCSTRLLDGLCTSCARTGNRPPADCES